MDGGEAQGRRRRGARTGRARARRGAVPAPPPVPRWQRVLGGGWIFQGVPAEELERLALQCEERHYTPGETVFREGDAADGLYVVLSGVVRIIAQVEHGERLLSSVGPGECFGEMGVIDGEPRSAAAVALTLASLCFVPTDPFLDLMERVSLVPMKLLALLSTRLRRTNRLAAELPADLLRVDTAVDT